MNFDTLLSGFFRKVFSKNFFSPIPLNYFLQKLQKIFLLFRCSLDNYSQTSVPSLRLLEDLKQWFYAPECVHAVSIGVLEEPIELLAVSGAGGDCAAGYVTPSKLDYMNDLKSPTANLPRAAPQSTPALEMGDIPTWPSVAASPASSSRSSSDVPVVVVMSSRSSTSRSNNTFVV